MRNVGHSLIELLVVLGVLGILSGLAMPPAARARDRVAVRAARDELAAALALTRLTAATSGGAHLLVDPATGRVSITTARAEHPTLDLTRSHGVSLEVGGGGPVEIRYDALGIGRFANRTIAVRRGAAVAGLTISAYGRFRRW